jgi:CheY-specific phosphatase CheX
MSSSVLSELLKELTPIAVVELFASYGVSVQEQPPGATATKRPAGSPEQAGEANIAGVVGFTGSVMRGTLLLATTFPVVAAARPEMLRKRVLSSSLSSDWILARDWAGELANQVLGRVKNRLNRFGVTFEVSPPTALSGPALTFASPKGPAPLQHVFSSGNGRVWLCFDVFMDPEQRVTPRGPELGSLEGNVIVFE